MMFTYSIHDGYTGNKNTLWYSFVLGVEVTPVWYWGESPGWDASWRPEKSISPPWNRASAGPPSGRRLCPVWRICPGLSNTAAVNCSGSQSALDQ